MILYPPYYKKHGIRLLQQLPIPFFSPLDTLTLPAAAILHHLPADDIEYGIAADDYLLRDTSRVVMVDHIKELGDSKGLPRSTMLPSTKLITDYHHRFRRLRPLRKLESAIRDPKTIIVENYALLGHLFRYTNSFFSSFYKWSNIQSSLWKRADEIAAIADRQQYLVCKLPTFLPKLSELIVAEKSITRTSLEPFGNAEALTILDIWIWLGENRANSTMSKMKTESLDKVNLIWVESGRWTVINLGLLNSWRSAKSEGGSGKGVPAKDIQRRFLRMLMSMFEARTVAAAPDVAVKAKPVEENPVNNVEGKADDGLQSVEVVEDEEPSNTLTDAEIEADLAELENFASTTVAADAAARKVDAYVQKDEPLSAGVLNKCDRLADMGMLSGAEYRRLSGLANKYQEIPSPDGNGTLADFLVIKPDDIKIEVSTPIPDIETVFDKSMLKSTLIDFDSRYVEKVLPKDVANAVLGIQNSGVAVTKFEVERFEDAMNKFDAYTIRLVPVAGSPSTVRFRLPVVGEDGTFKANGVKCRLRKQRGDMPIRKAGPARVALTSYYSKTFVDRSSRSVNNYPSWLTNQIVAMGAEDTNPAITDMRLADVYISSEKLPRIYTTLAKRFRSFKAGDYELNFDYYKRIDFFGAEKVAELESKGMVLVGKKGKEFLLVDDTDAFYLTSSKGLEVVGKIDAIVPVPTAKAPVEFAEVKVFGKAIPIGVVLAYQLGFEKLLKTLQVEPRRVPRGERVKAEDDEYVIHFSDESLVFSREDRLASMVLSGLNQYRDSIRNYSVYDFDQKDVYYNVLEANGLGVRYIREMDLMFQLFVDHITKELLIEMGEPTDLVGLLLRSSELLLTDYHPDETDMQFMRIRGYERLAGAVYSELVKSSRMFNARPVSSGASIELNPQAVWQQIAQDASLGLVEESNPIHNLKEKEVVTFAGTGGRNSRSMVKKTRVYHKNDMGVISEATVDSSDVAITTYLTADPNFTTLRGTTQQYAKGSDGPTALLSTSALLAPAATHDDPKRVNFINIQNSAGISAVGYKPTPLRTGYEQVIAHRTDDLFAYTAKGKGTIVAVDDKHITIEYADGVKRSVELGRRFGISAGTTLPHTVVTDLKLGDKVKDGEIVAYNSDFFQKDLFNPKQVLWKAGVLAKTAIFECTDTLEDSSVISERIAKELTTSITKTRYVVLKFDQTVRNIVKLGSEVDFESILCTIEDPLTADNDLFDEKSLDTLRAVSALTPKAKYNGTVEKIEVFYNGDKEDMSESLRALAGASDRYMGKLSKNMGNENIIDGRVDGSLRIDGNPLEMDTLAIKIYITGPVSAGVGDKGVFANQMKTIFGRVMSGVNETEAGEPIDAIFGYRSIYNRIVLSPEIIGTTNTLLRVLSKHVAKVYRGS